LLRSFTHPLQQKPIPQPAPTPTPQPLSGAKCDAMLPRNRPRDASTRENIRTTIGTVQSIYAAAAVGLGTEVEAIGGPGGPVDHWYNNMVAGHHPWDYKQFSPASNPMLYEDIGIFNLVATCAVAG